MSKAVLQILADIAGQLIRELIEAITSCLLRSQKRAWNRASGPICCNNNVLRRDGLKLCRKSQAKSVLRKERRDGGALFSPLDHVLNLAYHSFEGKAPIKTGHSHLGWLMLLCFV